MSPLYFDLRSTSVVAFSLIFFLLSVFVLFGGVIFICWARKRITCLHSVNWLQSLWKISFGKNQTREWFVCLFCCEGPICIHMNISIYIFFKAFLYVSKLLFNVCVSWKTLVLCVCVCEHNEPTVRGTMLYNMFFLPVFPSPIHSLSSL